MQLNSIRVSCEGRLKVTEIFDLGVTGWNSSVCFIRRDKETGEVNDEKHIPLTNDNHCLRQLDWRTAMDRFKDKCVGQKVCEWDDLKALFDASGSCIKEQQYKDKDFYL